MEKAIYLGNGLLEQLKYFPSNNIKSEPLTSNYLIMGSKLHKIYDVLTQDNSNLANLKIKAIKENAYIHPEWDYLRFPEADLSCGYQSIFTNESFEELDRDEYDDPILIYILDVKGIYKCNGNYAYSMNLEKKLKRKKDAEIVKIFADDYTEDDLKRELLKYNTIEKNNNEDEVVLYRFINKRTKESITSIYPNLVNIPNINKEEWIKK